MNTDRLRKKLYFLMPIYEEIVFYRKSKRKQRRVRRRIVFIKRKLKHAALVDYLNS